LEKDIKPLHEAAVWLSGLDVSRSPRNGTLSKSTGNYELREQAANRDIAFRYRAALAAT
jgi:hypothetical protein